MAKKDDRKVAILIPTYNQPDYLEQAIRSAVEQTIASRCWVCVIDDASPSQLWLAGVRRRWRPRGVRFVLGGCNVGHTQAILRGYRYMRDEIDPHAVIILDGDDMLAPRAAEEALQVDPMTVKIQWIMETIDAEGRSLGRFPKYPRSYFGFAHQRPGNPILGDINAFGNYVQPTTAGSAYYAPFLDRVMFRKPFLWTDREGIDGFLGLEAAMAGTVATSSRRLSYYRVHGDNQGAMETLSSSKIARAMQLREQQCAHVAAAYPSHVGDRPLSADMFYQERLLAYHRLGGIRGGFRRYFRAVRASSYGWAMKAMFGLWGLAVAYLPEKAAINALRYRFCAASRPGVGR